MQLKNLLLIWSRLVTGGANGLFWSNCVIFGHWCQLCLLWSHSVRKVIELWQQVDSIHLKCNPRPIILQDSNSTTTSTFSSSITTTTSCSSCHSMYGDYWAFGLTTWWSHWRPWWGGDRAGQVGMRETIGYYNCLVHVSYIAISPIANHKLRIFI